MFLERDTYGALGESWELSHSSAGEEGNECCGELHFEWYGGGVEIWLEFGLVWRLYV